ncbi:hypothetical protein JCM10914A_51210 [Paenibacillus sp. JCM 10914]|uniref:GNAT family N-acetyltransferase n=1 Tax=Paenibacillus sp. JCM 10914 TaxID=1236974 RepID=UPI0003CC2E0F|nr:GNAT family N-acetyltransferase [Paenibacillus sp. JCM 10914]GAE05181.1 acetyltransferase, GNAT family [Paenibacillus sp. JCM 10914]
MYDHRLAVTSDFDIIATFPQDARELFFMYPKGKYPIDPQALEEVATVGLNPTVVTHNNQVVGYANLYDVGQYECWLGNVIVSPAYRGKGAGRYLIETMQVFAKEELRVQRFRLVCHNINTAALLFYTKFGFTPIGSVIMQDTEGREIVGIKMEMDLEHIYKKEA